MADVDVDATLLDRGLAARLIVPDGQVLALLGPNGAGKSSLLGLVAGTLVPSSGRVLIGGRDVTGLPVHRRRVALLSQDALLFPHLSVLDNVAFAPRAAGASRARAEEVALRWLAEVGAEEFARRRPGQLSGGQAQRVAIARALAAEPDVLLLDEPFAALDVAVAPQLRAVLREVLRERTTVLVTHDLVDVVTLADRAVVLEAGRVVEDRNVRDLVESPHSRFAADLAGRVLLQGTLAGELAPEAGEQVRHGDAVVVRTALGPVAGLWQDEAPAGPGTPASALVDPAAVSVHEQMPHASPRNCWPVEVEGLEPHGGQLRVVARSRGNATGPGAAADPTPGRAEEGFAGARSVPARSVPGGSSGDVPAGTEDQEAYAAAGVRLAADITPAAAADLGIVRGRRLWFVVKAQQVRIYAAH